LMIPLERLSLKIPLSSPYETAHNYNYILQNFLETLNAIFI
jgi:hypothetical protein